MIRVIKPVNIPVILKEKGDAADAKNRVAYNKNPKLYKDGKPMLIDPNIYNHPSVKQILKKAQHNKCCFCEKDQGDEYGAIEHYRPKNGYQSARKQKLKTPGYYWLCYSWDNLYFVCSACNTTKANLFPLVKEFNRATSHKKNIDKESPKLIDPGGKKDPRNHIVFDAQFVRGKTPLGKKTIEICGLNRDALNEKRKELIDDISLCLKIVQKSLGNEKEVVDLAKQFLEDCQKPTAMFSATAIDYINQTKSAII